MSIKLGKFNSLTILKEVDFGIYLDGEEEGEILLPKRYVPANCQIGDKIEVFVYLDNEERLIATTQTPLAQVGEFAYLEVAWVNQYGAFLKWGLMKDLFVPFREQKVKMEVGRRYVVYVYEDMESFRIVASAKIDRFLSKSMPTYEIGQEVEAMVWQSTDLGYKVIVNNEYGGLIYRSEVFQPVRVGQKLKAFVKLAREDGKLDLILQKPGYEKVDDFARQLLRYIQEQGGFTPLNDKSDVDEIYDTFGVSKKTFKKAVGELYKKRLVVLTEKGIELA